jgi:hypothetical protein
MTIESDAEKWFAKRLTEHGVTILSGAADRKTRMERFRSAILGCYLEAAIAGKNAATGKAETYAQSFERLYGEPLQSSPQKAEHIGD